MARITSLSQLRVLNRQRAAVKYSVDGGRSGFYAKLTGQDEKNFMEGTG